MDFVQNEYYFLIQSDHKELGDAFYEYLLRAEGFWSQSFPIIPYQVLISNQVSSLYLILPFSLLFCS